MDAALPLFHPRHRLGSLGLSAEQAERGKLNPKMFNAFLDGSKPAIESAAIANACMLKAPANGLAFSTWCHRRYPAAHAPESSGRRS